MAADLLLWERLQSFTEETFLSFAVVGSGISIWVADNRGMRFHAANATAGEVMTQCRRMLALCADSDSDIAAISRTGEWLYQALIRPVEPMLDAERVLHLHADDDFPWIPFSLLRAPGGMWMVDRFRLKHCRDFPWHSNPSMRPVLHPNTSLLVVDAVDRPPMTVPAESEKCYSQRLASMLPGGRVLHSGSSTVAEFQQHAQAASLLHLRCALGDSGVEPMPQVEGEATQSPHPVTRERAQPNQNAELAVHFPAGLPDDWLRNFQLGILDPLDSPGLPDESEPGNSRRGYPACCKSLVATMHAAGLDQVLVPLWTAPEEARACYFESYYAGIRQGMPLVDCGRFAAREVSKQHRWRHPHHWAAFRCSTLYNRLGFARETAAPLAE